MDAAMTTVVTESSYMSRACSAESPASIIRAVNTSAPTTATPIAQDHEPDGGRGDRRQRDPAGDAPRDHVRAAR